MKYVKIDNLISKTNGICDYKGLDIDLFIAGSQVYDNDTAFIGTIEEDIPQHEDLQILSKNEYDTFVNEIRNRPQPLSEIDLLNEKIAQQDAVIEELLFNIIPEITGGV